MTFLNVMIQQVRGCDGMSTSQNGAAAYSQCHMSRICQGGFPSALPTVFVLPECPSMQRSPQLQRLSLDVTVFSQQPPDAESACPAFEMLFRVTRT